MKERQSNIELCRLFAMGCVVLTHTMTSYIFGGDSSLRPPYWWMILLSCFAYMGLNTFLLIPGYFSVKSKKSAYLHILYVCLFFFFVRLAICAFLGVEPKGALYFFVTNSNWFIPFYIGLLIMSPIFNNYIEKADKEQLAIMTLSLVAFDSWNDWLIPNYIQNRSGFTMVHFIAMYFVGRYIGIHGLSKRLTRWAAVIWMFVAMVAFCVASFCIHKGWNPEETTTWFLAFNNPFMEIGAIASFLTFRQLNIGSIKVINYCAQSVLAILLIHAFPAAREALGGYFNYCYDHYNGIMLFGIWIASVLGIMLVGILVDQLRIYSYNILKKVIVKK